MSSATTAQRAFQMLENESLWDVTKLIHSLLAGQGIPHAIVGGVAVCLHGYRRNTVDLDLLVRREDQTKIRTALEAEGYTWSAERAEFRAPAGIPVQFVLSGERAGQDAAVLLPQPDEAAST